MLSSPLWLDFADYIIANKTYKDFISKNVLYNVENINEMIWIISILDLPLKLNEKHEYRRLANHLIEIIPHSNLILLTKQLGEGKINIKKHLLLSQNITKLTNINVTCIPNNLAEKILYCHQVVATNISRKEEKFEIFYQLPQGAIPIENTNYSQTTLITIKGYEKKGLMNY